MYSINSTDTVQNKKKPCAGNGCKNVASYCLTIIYLNKVGWFCESCKKELVEGQLVIDVLAKEAVKLKSKGTGPIFNNKPDTNTNATIPGNDRNDSQDIIR